MTGIETHDIAQLADALSKDVGAEAGAVRVRVVSETDPQITSMVESIREANGFADPDKNSASDEKRYEFAARHAWSRTATKSTKCARPWTPPSMASTVCSPHCRPCSTSRAPSVSSKARSTPCPVNWATPSVTIVASGPHAPILHWMRNTGVVKTGGARCWWMPALC